MLLQAVCGSLKWAANLSSGKEPGIEWGIFANDCAGLLTKRLGASEVLEEIFATSNCNVRLLGRALQRCHAITNL